MNRHSPMTRVTLLGLCAFFLVMCLFFRLPTDLHAQNQPTATFVNTPDAVPATNPESAPTESVQSALATDIPTDASNSGEPSVEPFNQEQDSNDSTEPGATLTLVPDIEPEIPTQPASNASATPTLFQITPTSEASLTPTPAVQAQIAPTSAATETPTQFIETITPTDDTTPLKAGRMMIPLAAAVAEPDVELAVSCPAPNVAQFTLSNYGGDMMTDGHYTVSNPSSDQPFKLSAGETISFQAAGDAAVDAYFTTSNGTQVSLSAVGQCVVKESPTPSQTPMPANTLTPSNTPTRKPTNTPRPTSTPSNTPTITLTPSITPTATITLTPYQTFTPSITPTPSNTPLPSATFTPSMTFTPSNTPTLTFTPTITLTPSNTPLPSATFTPSLTYTPSNTPTPLPTATLQPGTPLIQLSVACLPVQPGEQAQARFRLRNVGGTMLTPGTYTWDEPNKPQKSAPFLLLSGEFQDLIAAGDTEVNAFYSTIVFQSVTLGVVGTCLRDTTTPTSTPTATVISATKAPTSTPRPANTTVPNTAVPPTPMPTNTFVQPAPPATLVPATATLTPAPVVSARRAAVIATPTATLNLPSVLPSFGGASDAEAPLGTSAGDWQPIAMSESVCPDWLIYHTNMTEDWEIFRLGELPNGLEADLNLSRGIGPDVYDIMPSRAPDAHWITFASNRDQNWEIYISSVDTPVVQRLTDTPDSAEFDPVWSPVAGQITYESNRDGNWNLYLFDVETGLEARLTDGPGNEMNAMWSRDGERMLFQSDAEGFWQVYEINVSTLEQRRISDGTAHDYSPQYSNTDDTIIFHSLREGENTVMYTMRLDGTELTRISDPAGNAVNHAWSPDDRFIAYQSDLDGDNDIYIYELSTKITRQLTNNTIEDYAPTWFCHGPFVVFTSDVTGDSNIFAALAQPMDAPALLVQTEAQQLTFDKASDQYPSDSPSEEDASNFFPATVDDAAGRPLALR